MPPLIPADCRVQIGRIGSAVGKVPFPRSFGAVCKSGIQAPLKLIILRSSVQIQLPQPTKMISHELYRIAFDGLWPSIVSARSPSLDSDRLVFPSARRFFCIGWTAAILDLKSGAVWVKRSAKRKPF